MSAFAPWWKPTPSQSHCHKTSVSSGWGHTAAFILHYNLLVIRHNDRYLITIWTRPESVVNKNRSLVSSSLQMHHLSAILPGNRQQATCSGMWNATLCFPSRSLCSASGTQIFHVPPMGKRTLGERSFQYIGPVIWNSLPFCHWQWQVTVSGIYLYSLLSSFKSKLKTHLFSTAHWCVIFFSLC